jgi:ribonuclease P/MRP protein subunit POP5
MLSLKALKPSKREKKRYIVYQITAEKKKNFSNSLVLELKNNLGVFGSAKAGILPIFFDDKTLVGIIKVNHKMVDEVRALFVLISELDKINVCIQTLGVSGILKKAKENYIQQ